MVKDFIFQRQDDKKGKKKGPWFFVLVLFFVAVFFFKFSPPAFLSRAATFVARPVLVAKNRILESASNLLSVFYFKNYLVRENQSLHDSLFHLEGVEAQLQLEKEENNTLRELSGMLPQDKKSTLLSVILKPPRFPYDVVMVNGGKDENLEVGNLVYAGDHVLVGQVEAVYGQTSKVKFLSSPGVVTESLIGSSSLQVKLVGIGGGNFEAKIPRGADVVEGDSVFIANRDHELIGTLGTIDPVSSDSYIRGVVRVPVNIFGLSYVTVEKKSFLITSPQ